jgi:hypothetical protein
LFCSWKAIKLHSQQHLGSFNGTLQADAYSGYQAIYETGRGTEAVCWAYARCQFYELHAARPNALNTKALEHSRKPSVTFEVARRSPQPAPENAKESPTTFRLIKKFYVSEERLAV